MGNSAVASGRSLSPPRTRAGLLRPDLAAEKGEPSGPLHGRQASALLDQPHLAGLAPLERHLFVLCQQQEPPHRRLSRLGDAPSASRPRAWPLPHPRRCEVGSARRLTFCEGPDSPQFTQDHRIPPPAHSVPTMSPLHRSPPWGRRCRRDDAPATRAAPGRKQIAQAPDQALRRVGGREGRQLIEEGWRTGRRRSAPSGGEQAHWRPVSHQSPMAAVAGM